MGLKNKIGLLSLLLTGLVLSCTNQPSEVESLGRYVIVGKYGDYRNDIGSFVMGFGDSNQAITSKVEAIIDNYSLYTERDVNSGSLINIAFGDSISYKDKMYYSVYVTDKNYDNGVEIVLDALGEIYFLRKNTYILICLMEDRNGRNMLSVLDYIKDSTELFYKKPIPPPDTIIDETDIWIND